MNKWRIYISLVLIFIILGLVIWLIPISSKKPFNNEKRTVSGISMEPLIKAGTIVDLDYTYYANHEIKRGDIIAYQNTRMERPSIKVVKAIPGDKFSIVPNKDGTSALIINGENATNSAGVPYQFNEKRANLLSLYSRQYNGILPPDRYLILGDIAQGTSDSSQFGTVPKEYIIAKATPQSE